MSPLYANDVVFAFTLSFKNDDLVEEVKPIDRNKTLAETENPYLGNVVGRTSYLIATLTPSNGHQSLVTTHNAIR